MQFLFVDRIIQLIPGECIRGIKHITADDFYLTVDEHGNPCFIPSLIGETLGQLAAWNVMKHNQFTARPVAGVVSSAQLHRPAFVGETLELESYIDALDDSVVQYHSVALVGNEPVFTIDGALGPLLPMEDFIAVETVKRQFSEICRPGDWPISSSLRSITPMKRETGPTVAPFVFDNVIATEAGISLTAEKYITRTAPYFPDHFPHKPVLPMTVLLECILNLTHEFILKANFSQKYIVRELRKIKMNEFVQPGALVSCSVKLKIKTDRDLILSCRSEVEGKRVCVVDVVFQAD